MTPQIRVMTPADIAAGMRLKDAAGWNQTVEDWQRFLQANPEGCFLAEWNGQVAGTTTTIVYEGRFAWIGMVLVDPAFRGRGIGTALLVHAINHLDQRRILCLKLDATPQGKPIYQRLGFQVEYEIERRVLERERGVAEDAGPAEDVSSVLRMDRDIFGADRGLLLSSVANAAPEFVVIARQDHRLAGYALGRKGSQADHLGPWVACSRAAARETLDGLLTRSARNRVLVDVMTDNPWAPALLAEKGFRFSRTLTRMYRGKNAHRGRPDLLCAILGPEFG